MLVATVAGACAHNPRTDSDPYVVSGVATISTWMNQLPRCPPSAETNGVPFRREADTAAAFARGPLTLAAHAQCKGVQCKDRCCNNCFAAWVVLPDGGDGSRHEIAIQRSKDREPMSALVRDCKLDAVRQQIPKPEVIVSGWMEDEGGHEKIIRASLCVVETPPAPPVK
jgi:hypothetical protein